MKPTTPTLLLFDLDETVAPDEEVNTALFVELVGAALGADGPRASALWSAFDAIIEDLWQQGSAADYSARLGISAWEGLWGPFGPSAHPMLGALHTFVPEYRRTAWERFVGGLGVADGSLARTLEARFLRERRARQHAYPWSADVLERLAGRYRLGMITNGAPDLQRLKLAGTGLADRFEPVIVSGDLHVGKPEPGIFARALAQAGVAPERAAMVGDSWARDMLGAAGAGLAGYWVNPQGAVQPAVGNGARIRSIPDLRALPAALLADETPAR